MKNRLQDGDYIFDGMAHRPFDPQFDGWRNELPDARAYPSVSMAEDILRLFDDLSAARKRIWDLEQELKLWKKIP